MRSLIKDVLGGAAISLGAFSYLITLQKTENVFLAAATFYLGLSLIMIFKQNLFTGMVLTQVSLPIKTYLKTLSRVWFGNLIGSVITTALLTQILHPDVGQLVLRKLTLSPLQMIIGGLFCNFLVCCAVASYKVLKNHLISWFYITLFVVFGFNHIVADFTYFSIALFNGVYIDPATLATSLICVTIGNFLGGVVVANTLSREED